jgi:transcriptional regulator with XRE-family HTH domain
LKLTKRQLSLNFHVDDTTIYLWEHNKVRPSITQIPKIIEFLGHDPFEANAGSLAEQIKNYRRLHGLSQKNFSEILGVDQSTLASWERRIHQPTRKQIEKFRSLYSYFDEE